jgi:tetratricopeptide (TPR) repeat protein
MDRRKIRQSRIRQKGKTMKLSLLSLAIRITWPVVVLSIIPGAACMAQGVNGSQVNDQQQNDQQPKDKQSNQTPAPAAPKVDPQEEAAYKTFYDTKPADSDNKIKLGQDFIQKYPMSRYLESVYAGLVQAYYAKQDWNNFNASADKALALNPDDIPVLVIVGWVIPHVYNPNDPDAAKNLDKGERYEKHAIELSGALTKPATMTDAQFLQSKSSALTEAHSALGLIYFRRQDPDDSVKELQEATQSSANPDATDLYVLGLELKGLNRNAEAADAFSRCGQIPGALQDRCKQSADAEKKQAPSSK